MIGYGRRTQLLAVGLSALAGYVDAVGFLASAGFFVSFMSGNSTRLAVGAARHSADAGFAVGLILLFLLGVICGAFFGRRLPAYRQPLILVVVAALLGAAASLGAAGLVVPATAMLALAMGVENTFFERNGEVSIGVTYMTGTLVKVGQRIAGALAGEAVFGWVPHLLLWLGLVAGAVAGAGAFSDLGFAALWIGAACAGLLAAAAAALNLLEGADPAA